MFTMVSLWHTNDFIMSRNTYLTENTRVKHKVAKKFFEHNSIVAIKINFFAVSYFICHRQFVLFS